MTTTAQDATLASFIDEVGDLVDRHPDEHELVGLVAERLRAALLAGIDLPPSVTKPGEERYVMYPLHVDPAGRFSIASAVWDVGRLSHPPVTPNPRTHP